MTWRKAHRNRRKSQQLRYELYGVTSDGRSTKKPIIRSREPITMIWTSQRSYTLNEIRLVPEYPSHLGQQLLYTGKRWMMTE